MPRSQSFLNILPEESKDNPKLCIALLGGGGKTSLMFQLGDEFAHQNKHTLLTSITKAGPPQNVPMTLIGANGNISLPQLFDLQNPIYLLSEQIEENKYKGISPAQLESFLPEADVTIFECDGSRNLPLKAHSEWDPMVPDFASCVIIIIGADVIHSKISEGKIHRPELFKSLWHIDNTTTIDVELVSEIVTNHKGYLSKIPEPVSKIYFVNKADAHPEEAHSLGESISLNTSSPVYFGSVKKTWWEQIS
ncbi:MAG: selenium cofactor biosynthesis protein YqeC [Fidelibacterota bacterium]